MSNPEEFTRDDLKAIHETRVIVDRLEKSVEEIKELMEKSARDCETCKTEINNRFKVLEDWRIRITGLAAGISLSATVAGNYLWNLFSKVG